MRVMWMALSLPARRGLASGVGAHYDVWIFRVLVPFCRVIQDVLPYAVQRSFAPDHVFVIVALPDGSTWGTAQLVDGFGGGGFKPGYQCTQRFWRTA